MDLFLISSGNSLTKARSRRVYSGSRFATRWLHSSPFEASLVACLNRSC